MATNGANDGARHVTANGKQSPAGSGGGGGGGGAVQPASTQQDNGIPGLAKALTNGDTHISGLGYPTPNGVSPSSPAKGGGGGGGGGGGMPESMYDLPEEVMHIAMDTHSLGALIQRVSAQCFNNLDALVDTLHSLPVPSEPPMTNGAHHQQPPPLSSADERRNADKKKKILNFASDYRAKFIKLLVVTDWARRDVNDVAKLIDLNAWLREQDDAAMIAANGFYHLIRDLRTFKLPNPDLETALAVLSGGDVPWIPHFGFREQKKLDAEEVLRVLHRMNTIINLRLVLHEELIPQLRDYRVADGRATFTFPQEFELDVYVASEDPEQPWFFLDVRFLFDPAPNVTGERLRGSIDFRINAALAESGLRGACELAHDFTLTHKINIFRKQAAELTRGVWAGALGIDMVRRTLTLQYWVESPQTKSWIEIGIVSGKDKSRRRKADNAISSQIKARWIRNGKEQKDVQVPMDLAVLSVENVLRAYIARHSSFILERVQAGLENQAANLSAGEERALQVFLTTSDAEPSDCALQARIGEHPLTTLQVDGITGRLYFSPAGPATPKAQEALERSKDPLTDAPTYLSRYLTYEIQVRIDRLIEILGWETMRHVKLSKEEAQVRMKRDVHRYSLFQPRGFKGSSWYIAYAINLSGESWWALETTGSPNAATTRLKLPSSADDDFHIPLDQPSLKKLEPAAVTAASFVASKRAFAAQGVSSTLKHIPDTSLPAAPADAPPKTHPVLIIRFSQLLRAASTNFALDLLQLQYLSFDTDVGTVKLMAKGRMRDPSNVRDILQRTSDPDMSFGRDGAFSIVVESRVGETPTTRVLDHLTTLGTLVDLATTLRKRGFECKELSFSRVAFAFAKDEEDIILHFPPSSSSSKDANNSRRITLTVPPRSPVRRVKPLMEDIVNDASVGFERFAQALTYFLPVLRAFDTIDSRHATHMPYAPQILPRQVDYFRLSYPNPHGEARPPWVAFDAHFKRNKDTLEWRVSDVSPGPVREERERMFPGLNGRIEGFMRGVGSGWTGMRTLLVADRSGIEAAILRLDEVVWGAMEEGRASGGDGGREVITID